MPVETRIYHNETWTVNGVTLRKLITAAYDDGSFLYSPVLSHSGTTTGNIAIDVIKRNSSGTETVIASKVGSASYSGTGATVSATASIAQTALAATDAIKITVYAKSSASSTWYAINSWITEQLNATQLDAATWTCYYYCNGWFSITQDKERSYSDICTFCFDSSTYNSRIEGFSWTPVGAAYPQSLSDQASLTDSRSMGISKYLVE